MEEVLKVVSQAFTALLVALLPVLVGFAIQWVKVKVAVLKKELDAVNPNIDWLLSDAAALAVRAAEQLGVTEQVKDKFQYATDMVKIYLAQYGIDIDMELIGAAVEAEVHKQFGHPVVASE